MTLEQIKQDIDAYEYLQEQAKALRKELSYINTDYWMGYAPDFVYLSIDFVKVGYIDDCGEEVYVDFPTEWLTVPIEEVKALVQAEKDRKELERQKHENAKKRIEAEQKAAKEKAEYERLKAKFEPKTD